VVPTAAAANATNAAAARRLHTQTTFIDAAAAAGRF